MLNTIMENENTSFANISISFLRSFSGDHNDRDHSSHLVKYAGETGHLPVDTANFEVIGSGYRNNARRRKIAEALLVKKPTLNIQEKSVPLKFFN